MFPAPAFHTPLFLAFFSNSHCCICAIAAAKAAKIPSMMAGDAQKTPSDPWQIRCFFFAHSSPFLLCYCCCCCPTIVIHHCPLCYSMVLIHSTGRGHFKFRKIRRICDSVALACTDAGFVGKCQSQTKYFLPSSVWMGIGVGFYPGYVGHGMRRRCWRRF
jgi:hypothetical protein